QRNARAHQLSADHGHRDALSCRAGWTSRSVSLRNPQSGKSSGLWRGGRDVQLRRGYMRIRPLTRHDAWRSIPQTLCMRGIGLITLATCGLLWPELLLVITLVDIGIICLLFALADLFLASAIRRESTSSARKIGGLGLLGLSFGALVISMAVMPVAPMRAAALIWLVGSGAAIIVL